MILDQLFSLLVSSQRRRQARRMDPTTRRALVAASCELTVNDDTASELHDLETQLTTAKAQLESSRQKEQFLDLRVRKYRAALDERAAELKAQRQQVVLLQQQQQQPSHDDDTTADDELLLLQLERRMEKWEQDEDALEKIVETHQQILVACEEVRRTIDALEKKKASIESMNRECEEFLTLAREAMQHDDNDDDDEANLLLEAGQLTTTADGEQETGVSEMEMAPRSRDIEEHTPDDAMIEPLTNDDGLSEDVSLKESDLEVDSR